MANIIEKYFEISKKFDLNFAQMSIKFCEIQKFITSTIIGATTIEQLKTNVESVNVAFEKETIKERENGSKARKREIDRLPMSTAYIYLIDLVQREPRNI